ncbi:hypothetical protein BLOT_013601 [Blomia tropicalis]|nr:hypothetical protein BLOT_013601 [Blomia tropicalis]
MVQFYLPSCWQQEMDSISISSKTGNGTTEYDEPNPNLYQMAPFQKMFIGGLSWQTAPGDF